MATFRAVLAKARNGITWGSCSRCLGCSRHSHGHPKWPLLESWSTSRDFTLDFCLKGLFTFTTSYSGFYIFLVLASLSNRTLGNIMQFLASLVVPLKKISLLNSYSESQSTVLETLSSKVDISLKESMEPLTYSSCSSCLSHHCRHCHRATTRGQGCLVWPGNCEWKLLAGRLGKLWDVSSLPMIHRSHSFLHILHSISLNRS